MTFGKIKSLIETNLIESYKNSNDFKKTIREFKYNILNNKSISKIYTIYDQLSSPQSLSEKEAKDFLEEGLSLLRVLLPKVKLPKTLSESVKNNYKDIDTLVYINKLDLKERLESRKNIISILMSEKPKVIESIHVPIKTMVNIANQTLSNYIENLDEQSKKEFFKLISEDTKILQEQYINLKKDTINKLYCILTEEKDQTLKQKLSETIEKIEIEKFDPISYLKLKNLSESI